jgi:Tfp pilus assembly protein PilE
MRRFTPIELAIGASLLGTLAAIAIPAFVRELHASRFSEPVDALARMSTAAVQYAEQTHKLPDSAPLTPPAPARGKREAFPAEIWSHPTWQALSFQAAPEGTPFAYAYAFDAQPNGFIARAQGDLDGDGVYSTFEVRGTAAPGEPLKIDPGMYVESELE